MLYGVSQAYGPHPFSDRPYHIGLFSNYQDLTFQQSGGVTVSAPPPSLPESGQCQNQRIRRRVGLEL
jgi:hypothetical protein